MDIAEKLRKAAGLFVELPGGQTNTRRPEEADEETGAPQAGARTVEQVVREAVGPNLDEIHVSPHAPPPPVSVSGQANFQEIYAQAGLPAVPFSAEQMRDMLHSLPAELPLPMRRQTVKVTLGAMGKSIGATSDSIVADASRKMAVLAAYAKSLSEQTKTQVAAAEQEMADLMAQIEEKRRMIEAAQAKLTQAVQLCDAETDHLDDVLEFFSLDVPPSKNSATE